jgi:hypothetical protein
MYALLIGFGEIGANMKIVTDSILLKRNSNR